LKNQQLVMEQEDSDGNPHADSAPLQLDCGEQRGFDSNVEPPTHALSNSQADRARLPNASAYQSKTREAPLALKADT
jgi:hypothetical protein